MIFGVKSLLSLYIKFKRKRKKNWRRRRRRIDDVNIWNLRHPLINVTYSFVVLGPEIYFSASIFIVYLFNYCIIIWKSFLMGTQNIKLYYCRVQSIKNEIKSISSARSMVRELRLFIVFHLIVWGLFWSSLTHL